MTDWELLRAWAEQHSEPAFAELVRRHLHLVYGSAMRQVRNPDLAQDVCQAVFLALARKAGRLGPGVILSGWLFRTTCHIAARATRSDYRRQRRELEAAAMNLAPTPSDPAPEHWPEVAPHLDAALASLPTTDRDAVVLRYFERQPFRVVGERCGITEDAAKKRVTRAVNKLRDVLAKRGVALTPAALAALLIELPAEAAPEALSGAITTATVNSTVSSAVETLAKQGLNDLLVDQVKTLLPWAAAAAILFGGAAIWWTAQDGHGPSQTALQVASENSDAQPHAVATSSAEVTGPRERGPSRIVLTVLAAENNRPLVAEVRARESSFKNPDFKQDLATDTNGAAEIPINGAKVDNLRLWISAPGYIPLTVGWHGHEFVESVLRHTTRLTRGQILQGIVQDEKGAPIPDARITFNSPGMDLGERENIGFHGVMNGINSDDQGRFHSDQLPLPLGEHGMSYSVEHPDYVRETVSLMGLDSLQTNHVVILKTGFKLSGTVVDLENQPIPQSQVVESHHFGTPRRSTTTDATGAFEIGPFAPGDVRLEASAEGFKENNTRLK